MVYSDSTNKNGIIQRAESLLGFSDAYISGNATLLKQFTAAVNAYYNKVVVAILESQDEWDFDDSNHTDFPILTSDFVADQQDYSLPSTTLEIKRIEITYDGTNWYKAEPIDVGTISDPTDTTSIASNFNVTEPYYDLQYGSIFLYPIPDINVTGGIKIWITREVDYFTSSDTTQEPGFDETFHEMLPVGAAMDYAVAHQMDVKNDLATLFAGLENKLKSYFGSKQKDRVPIMKAAFVNYK